MEDGNPQKITLNERQPQKLKVDISQLMLWLIIIFLALLFLLTDFPSLIYGQAVQFLPHPVVSWILISYQKVSANMQDF